MNNVIFSFSKPSPQSTVVGNHLATFIGKVLDLPVIWQGWEIKQHDIDILFIVNGAFAFCDCLPELGAAIVKAERIVWIQNDYTIKPPITRPGAESPFRKAFQIRHQMGKPPTDWWTTVKENSKQTKLSSYINWNQMTASSVPMEPNARATEYLVYYGAFRQQRINSFDRYFLNPRVRTYISSTSSKFELRYPRCAIVGGIPKERLQSYLNQGGLGLYIEDKRSHKEWHSPANRFYEMLSAGLPMAFDSECGPQLHRMGIDVSDYTVGSTTGHLLRDMMRDRMDIAHEQHMRWWKPYRRQLRDTVLQAYAHLLRRHNDDT